MKNLVLFLLVITAQQAYSQCDSFVINFTVADTAQDTLVCTPAAVEFKDISTYNRKDNSIEFRWSFGDLKDRSVLQNPAHTYLDAGTYDVKFYAETSNGCKDSITKQGFIFVVGPKVDFKLINDSVCQGDSLFVELNTNSVGPVVAIIKLGDLTAVNATSKRKRIGLLVDTKSGGKKAIVAKVSTKIKDPITGVQKDCHDIYPNTSFGEDFVLAHINSPLPELDVRGWPNTGLYLSNATDYAWHYWVFDGDTIRTDTFKTTVNGNLTLIASSDTCQISRSWNSVGINERPEASFDMRYSQLQAKLTMINKELQFQVSVYNTNGQLVMSESTSNGTVIMDLSSFRSGIYMVKAQVGERFWSTSIMR